MTQETLYYVPELEEVIWDSQEQFIRTHFGHAAAEHANYGWFMDDVARVACTKVYGYGVLSTSYDSPDHHSMEAVIE